MKKLSRSTRGQVSCSSDPEIQCDIDLALIAFRDITMFGEMLDKAHLVNAWLWGLARLPDEQRHAITEILVEDLERWRREEPMLGREELLSAVRQALVDVKGTRIADVSLRGVDCENQPSRKRSRKPSGRA